MKAVLFYLRLALFYGLFFAGAFVLGLLVFPFVPGATRERRLARRRRIARRCIKLYLGLLQRARLMRLEIHNAQALPEGPSVLIANHPSIFDALILMSLGSDAVCFAKRQLRRHPAFASCIALLGYVTADCGEATLHAARDVLATGSSLIMFPEGTRTSLARAVDRFQRGAASIALRTGVPICPIVIRCEPRILCRERGILESRPCTHTITLTVLPAINVPQRPPSPEELPVAARELTARLEMRYTTLLAAPTEPLGCQTTASIS